MATPFVIYLVFTLAVLVWSLTRPSSCRIFLGLFFLAMALGVNVPILIVAPEAFAAMGEEALVPLYRWFFRNLVARVPVLFVVPIILYEIFIGVLLLGRGRHVRDGLVAGTTFLLAISPLGLLMLPNVVLAGAMMILQRTKFPVSFLGSLRALAFGAGRKR